MSRTVEIEELHAKSLAMSRALSKLESGPLSWRTADELPVIWRCNETVIGEAKVIKNAYVDLLDSIAAFVNEVASAQCLHCDLQGACAEGEDGMPTSCNSICKVRQFVELFSKPSSDDGLPF